MSIESIELFEGYSSVEYNEVVYSVKDIDEALASICEDGCLSLSSC